MKPTLEDLYRAWLTKHNAPDTHPHRELYDMLVGAITEVEQDMLKVVAATDTLRTELERQCSLIDALVAE